MNKGMSRRQWLAAFAAVATTGVAGMAPRRASAQELPSGLRSGPRNLITDVEGLKIGLAEDREVATGVTVILPDEAAVAASGPPDPLIRGVAGQRRAAARAEAEEAPVGRAGRMVESAQPVPCAVPCGAL